MRRLWILISGYNDARGLERACQSVRKLWPDPDRVPIIYADGAYDKFPHQDPVSTPDVFEVAERFCTFIIRWPVAAPTEFLKRTAYWAGNEGDYVLILDTDETVESACPQRIPDGLTEAVYLEPLRAEGKQGPTGRVLRMFRVENSIHHWGSHESVFVGHVQRKRMFSKPCELLTIVHESRWDQARKDAKRVYYGVGIHQDEREFRRLIGA